MKAGPGRNRPIGYGRAGAAVNNGTIRLRAKWRGQARPLCEQLVSHVMGRGRLELYMLCNEDLTGKQQRQIRLGVGRLAAGEPLQYVLGNADFMGRCFKVNRNCLIPRPETEELVELISGFTSLWKMERPRIAEVGTGCGCIAVTLALERPEAEYIAMDVSRKALNVARANAGALGVLQNIKFRTSDILSGMKASSLDAIISNPPYVSTAEWRRLDRHVREHEPRIALDGGRNGLDIIGPLADQAFRTLRRPGLLFMEIGAGQWLKVQALLRGAGFRENTVHKDISGRNRMVTARK